MNSVYFFLPFILVASLGIYQDTFAVEAYRGENYQDITNLDGTHTWTGGLTPWILDGGDYQPFIFSDGSAKTIETGYGSVKLNPDGSYSFFKKGKINESELFTDRIVAKYADITNLNSWTYPNSVNNDTPDISWDGNEFVSSKESSVGKLEYKYIISNGKWKTQLEATNFSGLTTKAFGFDQIIDLNRDTIMFNDIQRDLDNFNGTTFDKQWLDTNKANVIDFLNNFYFDFDLGYENLYSITIIDTGANKSRLIFDYRTSVPLLPNETLIIDPTWGYTTGTIISIADTGCNATADSSSNTGYVGTNAGGTLCSNSAYYFDITTLPDDAIISAVNFRSDTTEIYDAASTVCRVLTMSGNPSTMTDQQILDDMWAGSLYTTLTTECRVVANNYVISPAGFVSDLQAELAVDNEWSIGINGTNYIASQLARLEVPELEVTYIVGSPPNPITSLNATNIGANSVDIIWAAPNSFGSGTFQNYTANSTTPWDQPLTFVGNTTSLFYNVTGLTFGTQYSFRVSAVTEIPYNTTGSYILNITTASNTYGGAPTQLTATSGLPTTITTRWNSAIMDNILGYRIERETPIDTGWATLVSNTTNTITNYNDTSVTTNIKYNYRVSALNGSGFSSVSNEADSYAYHIPDAVTDLVGTATDFSTVELDWTAPALYADLIGYRVNFTTPYGDPVSIALPNPYTTGTSGTIFDLIPGGNYSFRVAPVTIFGANASGNIVNVTTSSFLTPGDLTTGDITNTEDFKIFFDRDDINATAIQVDVTYSDTYDLSCDLSYQLARSNQTYSNMTETVVSADEVESSFLFINATGDIIHIKCWDVNTGDEAMYVLTITDFPFLDQIGNMRNGTYGTYFQIGAIDGVTLMICILAMIGFNRTNPIGGIVFLVITVGVLSFFQIITYPIVMYPALALLMVWGFISTRKDD